MQAIKATNVIEMQDLMKEHKLRCGDEVIGSYGECGGVSCPFCATRQYPPGEGGEVKVCVTCGNGFFLPFGYYRRPK